MLLACERARVGDDPEDPVSLARLVLSGAERDASKAEKDDSLSQ